MKAKEKPPMEGTPIKAIKKRGFQFHKQKLENALKTLQGMATQ